MKPTLKKRLSSIELVMAATTELEQVVVDFSVFSDAELDRLEWFALQRNAWTGDDWGEVGLTRAERRELDGFLDRVN